MSERIELQSMLKAHGIIVEKTFWLNNLQNDWAQNRFAQFVDAGRPGQKVAILIDGVRDAEAKLENAELNSGDTARRYAEGLVPAAWKGAEQLSDAEVSRNRSNDAFQGDAFQGDAFQGHSASEPEIRYYPPVVDSSKWTGLPADFALTEQRAESLISMLSDVERALDSIGADNSEKAMARAYIVAAKALADAPDPPVDIIWELINRANSLAGIASLFVSVIALFAAVH